MENKDVQKIAKMTIQYAKEIVKPGMDLIDLRKKLEKKTLELGADSFQYWDVGVFIFSGVETNASISRKRQFHTHCTKECRRCDFLQLQQIYHLKIIMFGEIMQELLLKMEWLQMI